MTTALITLCQHQAPFFDMSCALVARLQIKELKFHSVFGLVVLYQQDAVGYMQVLAGCRVGAKVHKA